MGLWGETLENEILSKVELSGWCQTHFFFFSLLECVTHVKKPLSENILCKCRHPTKISTWWYHHLWKKKLISTIKIKMVASDETINRWSLIALITVNSNGSHRKLKSIKIVMVEEKISIERNRVEWWIPKIVIKCSHIVTCSHLLKVELTKIGGFPR